jgi:uroporphyrinogen III methyltransferase / synthase
LKVYLVGSGPGDPELLTLKAKRLLESADCVLYDHLASPEALALAPATAEKLYVGKRRDDHSFPQEEIAQMLIERWRQGKRVIRLKGGDPYIFGRGGEECEALADAGVPFEVVPGITAPIGVGAYAGIPLTHRDHSSHVAFVTGHHPEAVEWHKIAHADTLVIFMGVQHFAEVAAALVAAGRPGDTPAAAVAWGTRARQRSAIATIATLEEAMREAQVQSPAMIYVGGVAQLAHKLNWYSALPLFGLRVAITRPRAQSPEIARQLAALGAEVIDFPTIEIHPPHSYAALDQAIAQLESYQWLIFTSANGVEAFRQRLAASPRDWRHLRAKLCTIGPATRQAVESLGLKVDLMPAEYVAEGLLAALEQEDLSGQRILIPRATVARDTAPIALRERGAIVDVVDAYQTLPPREKSEWPEGVDWITFTSSSTVKNFLALTGPEALRGLKIASIGPVTSATLRQHGFEPTVEANPYTTQGLLDAILHHHTQS